PLPRFNSVLIAAPNGRIEEVIKQLKVLDAPTSPQMKPSSFSLKKASAQIVAQQLQNFYNTRYPNETQQQNLIRFSFDVASNSVIVQAGPQDTKDIAELVTMLDTKTSSAVNDLRVLRLKNAFADEIQQIIVQSFTASVVNSSANSQQLAGGAGGAGGINPNATGGLGGAGGGFGQQQQQQQFGQQNRQGAGGALNTLAGGNTGITTKTTSLRFYNSQNGQVTESGFLEDVHVIANARINSLVVAAPTTTMRLIEKLVEELDVPNVARADVKVFTLKRADAQATLSLISQLFAAGGAAGGGGNQFGGNQLGNLLGGNQFGGGNANQNQANRPLLTLTGAVADGAGLLNLRATVDIRTNTLIVAGSPTDLDTIRAIVARLEDAEATQLLTKVYKLRHASAADVQTAVFTFLQNKLSAESAAYQTVFQTIQRQVFIQPEPVSNTLLIGCAPQLFDEVVRLIEKVDAQPPQVYVQVLIAEVSLTNTQEFGVEVGLQSPILFTRSLTGGTGLGAGNPGFNFNTTAPLPNNTIDRGVVGFQGLGNLGVGRSGSTNVGGFVFSAAGDTFNLLIRALKAQGRVDVLSRPQLLLMDSQAGFFQVGQQFPILGNTTNNINGVVQAVTYVNTGVTMRVTPRINPDGKVLMRVEPQISAPSSTQVSLGNGTQATAIDTQALETTVLASDGETVVLGGLIRRTDQKTQAGIPWLSDLPYIGAAFRYRTQQLQRRELIFIVTPHIVRNDEDLRRVGAEEAKKMNWSLREAMDVHGHGYNVLSGQAAQHQNPAMYPTYCPPGANPYGSPMPNYGYGYGYGNTLAPSPNQTLPGGVVPDGIPSQSTPL
ncbi:MAG: secretin N-terminal domain-containing protein, partial [Gemmataceae bacterium]